MEKLPRYDLELDYYWDYGDGYSEKTYYIKEYPCDNGHWVSDEEVAKLEALYEELIRHAAELELENMLLKKQR